MATSAERNHARAFRKHAEEYVASAEDNLDLERYTPAVGDAIHAGITAKDAIVTVLTGATNKGMDHAAAVKEVRQALAGRTQVADAERSLRELIGAKGDVEYCTTLITRAKAEPLVRRARALVDRLPWYSRTCGSV